MIHENASDGKSREFSLVFRGSSLKELNKEVTPQSSSGLKTALPRNSESLTLRPSRTGFGSSEKPPGHMGGIHIRVENAGWEHTHTHQPKLAFLAHQMKRACEVCSHRPILLFILIAARGSGSTHPCRRLTLPMAGHLSIPKDREWNCILSLNTPSSVQT